MKYRSLLNSLLGVLVLVISVHSSPVRAATEKLLICSEEDPTDCYPRSFTPTNEWQPVRVGQEVPQGLEYKIDIQQGSRLARLIQDSNNVQENSLDISAAKEAIEKASNAIVSYTSEEAEEDPEIQKLKMAVQGASTEIDVKDALEYIVSSDQDDSVLKSSLDSLTEHSHNLKDGVLISEPQYFNKLVELASNDKRSVNIREMSLRVIAQALRHNPKALDNVQVPVLLPKFLSSLQKQDNSVLQKRLLGVISSLVQSESNAIVFKQIDGEDTLLASFSKLKDDSKVRAVEILEDVKKYGLTKRSEDDLDKRVFETIQKSLFKKEVESDHALEALFDKAVELKMENKKLKTDSEFLKWLSAEVEQRKLAKRDGSDDFNEELHKKLLEARHVVFGNPNALRKAFDEL